MLFEDYIKVFIHELLLNFYFISLKQKSYTMHSKHFTKSFALLFIFFSSLVSLLAQYDPVVTTTNMGNGKVQYNTSGCTDPALRFFIFDDGFYSFENNPLHHYPQSFSGHNAMVWFSEPYADADPTFRQAPLSGPTGGGQNTNPEIYMPTNPLISTSWALSQNRQHYYMLIFRNNGSTTISGCLDFYYNSTELNLTGGILEYNNWVYNKTFLPSNEPLYNSMIKWNFNSLQPGKTRIVYIPMTAVLPTGTKVKTASRMRVNCVNGGALMVHETEVKGTPHDPNHKTADRACSGLPSPPAAVNFTYKINFKNIGSDFAQNVVISDQFSDDFSMGSLVMLGSGFPYTYTVTGNTLTITFTGINLPGTKQRHPYIYPDSHTESWVEFTICIKAQTAEKWVSNVATVYFDNLPGIATNVEKTPFKTGCSMVLCGPSSRLPGESIVKDITLSPNPVNNIATLNAYSELPTIIEICNTSGAIIKQLHFDRLAGETQVDVSDLTPGLYVMKVKSADKNVSLKFIKIE